MKVLVQNQKYYLVLESTLVLTFSFLMVISAQLRIPLFFTPVPVTLQTLVLFLSIVFLKHKAFFSQVIYIFLGLLGLPVFSKGGTGLFYLLGPTGGYILGFLVVAFIFPYFLPKGKSFFKIFFFFIFASFLYFSIGAAWLIFLHNFSLISAITAGVLPFIIGDVFKASLASFIFLRIININRVEDRPTY
jgi:biotin transport system substrate-specific component